MLFGQLKQITYQNRFCFPELDVMQNYIHSQMCRFFSKYQKSMISVKEKEPSSTTTKLEAQWHSKHAARSVVKPAV